MFPHILDMIADRIKELEEDLEFLKNTEDPTGENLIGRKSNMRRQTEASLELNKRILRRFAKHYEPLHKYVQ